MCLATSHLAPLVIPKDGIALAIINVDPSSIPNS